MSFFHKTLKDVDSKLEKGDVDGALQILAQHHISQGDMNKSINELIKALLDYEGRITHLHFELQQIKTNGASYTHPKSRTQLAGYIDGITEIADRIHRIMMNLLEEDSKLK